jgi:brefeldin A-resistance guanine nucleotide exchange factor 1
MHHTSHAASKQQVKKKMEEGEFARNLRGVNDGQDFPREFLAAIYHSICSGE